MGRKPQVKTKTAKLSNIAPKYLEEKSAAEYLGIASRTLRRWRINGIIDRTGTPSPKSIRRGSHYYYKVDDLDCWIEDGDISK